MSLRQAAQQALEALEGLADYRYTERVKNTMASLRAALAEPEQEPDGISWLKRDSGYFTAPTPRKPLTDEEIDRITDQQWGQDNHKPIYAAHRAYARAIERAHGIGEQHGS